jgi:hypothetical protein
MCGRFALYASAERIRQQFVVDDDFDLDFSQPGGQIRQLHWRQRVGRPDKLSRVEYFDRCQVTPVTGRGQVTPINGRPYTQVARSTAEDIELALDAAHAARRALGHDLRPADRANVLLKIADRIEANLERPRLRRDRG